MRFLRLPRKFIFTLLLTVFSGAIFFFALPAITNAAFGISPPFLNADHLVPGVTYQQTIYLVQDQPNQDLGVQANLDIPDAIKSWITIDKGFSFTIPQGARQFPVVITIKVPQGVGIGKYTGNLTFTTEPSTGGQVAIALGANVAINLTVGTGIYESYKVLNITLPDIEEGWNPRATIRFENDGNIPEGIDGATFDLYDQFDAVRLAYMTKNDGFQQVAPFATQEYTVEFPTDFHLGVGDYWGNVTLYKDNQVVGSEKTIFHVLPAGSLSPFGRTFAFLQGWIFLTIVALVVLIGLGWLWWRSRRKKSSHIPAPSSESPHHR